MDNENGKNIFNKSLQEYFDLNEGVGYELYAKGIDRISVQCKTISDISEKYSKLIRENASSNKIKKTLNELKKYISVLNKEMEGIVNDVNNLEGYKN